MGGWVGGCGWVGEWVWLFARVCVCVRAHLVARVGGARVNIATRAIRRVKLEAGATGAEAGRFSGRVWYVGALRVGHAGVPVAAVCVTCCPVSNVALDCRSTQWFKR